MPRQQHPHNPHTWHPSAPLTNLQQRAKSLTAIRTFFAQRHVMEVETPLLAHHSVTDPHMNAIRAENPLCNHAPFYLQTSPEYAMKRLLAADSGPIYQISKAFRQAEQGPRHNAEFTLLEWYRPGFDHHQLMDEVDELMQAVTGSGSCQRISYRHLFDQHFAIDPHSIDCETVKVIAQQHVDVQMHSNNRDDWLNLLLAEIIEPTLGRDVPVFIYDYPTSQATLAKIGKDYTETAVAQRFELYYQGIELANGYHELTDVDEQQRRFVSDQHVRQTHRQPHIAIDPYLMAAMRSGIPPCAGVALGVDRLLMTMLKVNRIEEVIAFSTHHA